MLLSVLRINATADWVEHVIKHGADPNFISLFLTQYIIEDLIDHPKVQDVFGDDLDIYRSVDSILNKIRPS